MYSPPQTETQLSPSLVDGSMKMLLFGRESLPHSVQQKHVEVQADVPGNYKILICWIFIGWCLYTADGLSHWVTVFCIRRHKLKNKLLMFQ